MSYDLMVFEPTAAPREHAAFMIWYDKMTAWKDSIDYNDPKNLTPSLYAWFHDMIEAFPPMNGPLASHDFDNPKVTDYSLGATFVYIAFAWSECATGYAETRRLAHRHHIGFFDASGDGDIYFPDFMIKADKP